MTDPRKCKGKRHSLHTILTVAIMAVICGNEDFEGMEEFAICKRDWLSQFRRSSMAFPLPIPSAACLQSWAVTIGRLPKN